MLADVQGIIIELQSFLWCSIAGIAMLSGISWLFIPGIRMGGRRNGWFAIFISQGKRTTVVVTFLFVRLFYLFSLHWMINQLSMTSVWIYAILELLLCFSIRDIGYVLYETIYSTGVFSLFYLLYMMKRELAKAFVTRGMMLLYLVTIFMLLAATIGQFLLSLYYITSNRKNCYMSTIQIRRAGILLCVFLILYCILPFHIINSIEYIRTDTPVYQMIQGEKEMYSRNSRISLTEQGCLIEEEERSTMLKDSLLYWEDEKKVLFTKTYSIVRPSLMMTNRINTMSMLEWEENVYYVTDSFKAVPVSDFFLFDGKDTYYFTKDTILEWNEQTLLLPSFSEVVVKYNQWLSVYIFENDEYLVYNTGNGQCIATMSGREKINLSTDILYRENGQEQMLFLQPTLLQDLE